MIAPGDAVIAGVSGGVDSVCLLFVLLEYRERMLQRKGGGFHLEVLHVEHGLRGADSLEDARFVEALCREKEVPCSVVGVNVAKLVSDEGLSVEEAARRERYRAFSAAADALLASYRRVRIAVAHQMEDQAETILFHIARGSGLDGLVGMRPVRDDIIRPLLMVSRGEIEEYVLKKSRARKDSAKNGGIEDETETGVFWRTDSTNADTDYTRNRIRHLVLPVLTKEVNAGSVQHICEAGGHIREALRFVNDQAQAFLDRYVKRVSSDEEHLASDKICIDIDALRNADPLIQSTVLRRVISTLRGGLGLKDVGSVHIRDLQSLAFKGSGKRIDLPGGVTCLRKGRQMIIFAEKGNKLSRARNEKEKKTYEGKNFASDFTEGR